MKLSSFNYKGTEYKIDKVIELEPENGNQRIKVITGDNKNFILTFNETIYRWVVTELIDYGNQKAGEFLEQGLYRLLVYGINFLYFFRAQLRYFIYL